MDSGWRSIVISEHERLELRNDQMVVKNESNEVVIPLDQIRDLMIAYPTGSITFPLLQRLIEKHVNVIICDRYPATVLCRIRSLTT